LDSVVLVVLVLLVVLTVATQFLPPLQVLAVAVHLTKMVETVVQVGLVVVQGLQPVIQAALLVQPIRVSKVVTRLRQLYLLRVVAVLVLLR
jgi:hypothetical protein